MKSFFLLFVTTFSYATTFMVQSVEKQLHDADGIVIGSYLRSEPILLENGNVATQMIIKADKEVGLHSAQLGFQEFIIHYPGGKMNGKTVFVEGVPRFIAGEKVAMMVRNVDGRLWGLNLGMGAYKMATFGTNQILTNSIFPQHKEIGQMTLIHFEALVKKAKAMEFTVVGYKEESYSEEELKMPQKTLPQRMPASVGLMEPKREQNSSISAYWFVLILGLCGAFYQLLFKRSSRLK